MPSLGRYLAQMEASGLGRADLLRDERGLLDAFKQQSLPYLTIRPSDDWEWLALAQHYRLPTRCLDWSRSPLVALYFALEPAVTYGRRDEDGDVAVYVWIDSEVEVLGASQLAGRSPWDLERTVVFQPPRTHPRISSQSAALSVHPKPWEELDDASVEKLIIPRERAIASGVSAPHGRQRGHPLSRLGGAQQETHDSAARVDAVDVRTIRGPRQCRRRLGNGEIRGAFEALRLAQHSAGSGVGVSSGEAGAETKRPFRV
ncbi:MAG: FRG domain-containing protein [Gemmatimonadetes bacterium]|nr:FRG domain-containing protein [Gemmatimonadota bacterium]